MGQRLVVTIFDDGRNKIANSYFHWSAYTLESLYIVDSFLAVWEHDVTATQKEHAMKNMSNLKDLVCLTMMEAWEGARPTCLCEMEGKLFPKRKIGEDEDNDLNKLNKLKLIAEGMFETAKQVFNKPEDIVHRNRGLIGFTEASIDENLEYAEYCVDIYLKRSGEIDEIYFGVMEMMPEEDYVESFDETEELEAEDGEPKKSAEDSIHRTDFRIDEDTYLLTLEDWHAFVQMLIDARDAGKYVVGTNPSVEPDLSKRHVVMLVA